MSYLVCYKCDVYYEEETEEDVYELTHCECGEKLIYFENLEDSYADVDSESLYEALGETNVAFVDLEETSDTQPREVSRDDMRETLANGTTYTQKKASHYEQIQDHGQLLIYAGVIIFIISLLALFRTLNPIYSILTLAGVILSFYGNTLVNKAKKKVTAGKNGMKGKK